MEKIYYLYRHIREDKNQPFYIGIGTKNSNENYYRSKAKDRRNHIWNSITSKTDYYVEIMIESNDESYIEEKEKEFISLYGRICERNGGILANIESGGKRGCNNPTSSKRLYCCNNKTWYNSIAEASYMLGIERTSITRVLNGEILSTKGFVFKECDDCVNYIEDSWKPLIDIKYSYFINENKQIKKVLKVEEDGVIIAMKERYIKPVEREYGRVQMTISYQNTKITVNLKKEYFKIFGKEW